MITQINTWLGHWEPLWLILVLLFECLLSMIMIYWMVREYHYDADKDLEKKQRKTRTSKKTSESKDGTKTTEEVVEVSEPADNKVV